MSGQTDKTGQALLWQARFDGQDETEAALPKRPRLESDFSAIGAALRKDTADALEAVSFSGFEAKLLSQITQKRAEPRQWRRILLLAGAGTALCMALFGAFLLGLNQAQEALTNGPGVVVEGLALQNENKVKVFEAKGEEKQVTVIWLGETER